MQASAREVFGLGVAVDEAQVVHEGQRAQHLHDIELT